MIGMGLIGEVQGLLEKGFSRELTSMKGLGYREISAHLMGETGLDEAVSLIKRNSRRFAKRQMTWFRAEPDVLWRGGRSRNDLKTLAGMIARDLQDVIPLRAV